MLTRQEEEGFLWDIRGEERKSQAAVTKLYNHFKESFTRKVICKYSFSEDDANDAYHEAFDSMIRQIIDFRYKYEPGALSGYFAIIFRNKCVDILRDKIREDKKRKSILEKLPQIIQDEIMQKYDTDHLKMKIELCYQKIGQSCKDFMENSREGFTSAELAVRMSFKTANAAKQKKFDCRKKLWLCLNPTKYE
jgi:RNA polymerase sigma factor (sigma-70 family)